MQRLARPKRNVSSFTTKCCKLRHRNTQLRKQKRIDRGDERKPKATGVQNNPCTPRHTTTHTHRRTHRHTHTHRHTQTHTDTHRQTHTDTHTHPHTHTQTHTNTHTQTHTHTLMSTCTRARTHSPARTHALLARTYTDETKNNMARQTHSEFLNL